MGLSVFFCHSVTPKEAGSGWEGVDEGGGVACEGLEDVPSLFSRRGDDGAERGEVLSGVESSESAGDFIFTFIIRSAGIVTLTGWELARLKADHVDFA
jgi:hypothetical protein